MAFTTPVNRVVAFHASAATASSSAITTLVANRTLVFFACASKSSGFPTTKAVITDNSGGVFTYTECGDAYLNDSVNPELRITAYKTQVGASPPASVTFTVTSTGSARVCAHATEFVTAELNFGATWTFASNTQVTSTTDVSYTMSTAPSANAAVLACVFDNGTNNIALATGFTNLVGITTGITVTTDKKLHVGYDITAPPTTSAQWVTNNIRQSLLALTIPPPSTADAWNMNDASGNMVLSASDKTATLSTAVTGGVRSTQKYLNGTEASKLYAEFLLANTISGNSCQVGIRETGTVLNSSAGSTFQCASNSGNIVIGSATTVGNIGGAPLVNGDVICLAWVPLAERGWFRKNGGLWNNDASADPATNTNGLDISTLNNTDHALLFLAASALNGAVVTVRTELAEFTQAVPSGFLSWMGETPAVTLAGIKVWSGSAWAEKPAKVWSGSAWVTKPVKIWSGSAWI